MLAQVYNDCPSAGSDSCFDDDAASTGVVGCSVPSVAGRIGSTFSIGLDGPESADGTVQYLGDGIFSAEYLGPIAGTYELEVRWLMSVPRLQSTVEKQGNTCRQQAHWAACVECLYYTSATEKSDAGKVTTGPKQLNRAVESAMNPLR